MLVTERQAAWFPCMWARKTVQENGLHAPAERPGQSNKRGIQMSATIWTSSFPSLFAIPWLWTINGRLRSMA
jgi:hypothetical protein